MATGSLLGKADASLVKAATDAAMAGIPKDTAAFQKRVMDARAVGMRGMATAITKTIDAAAKIGGALVEKNKKTKLINSKPNSYGGDEAFETDPNADEGFEMLGSSFENYIPGGGDTRKIQKVKEAQDFSNDTKIKKFTNQKNVLEDQKRAAFEESKDNATGSGLNISYENWQGFTNQKEIDKLNNKLEKRTGKLTKRSDRKEASTYVNVLDNDKDEVVERRTVEEQIKAIRKESFSLGMFGDKDKINPDTGEVYTKKDKKEQREKLKRIKNNLKQSVVEFQTFGKVLDEKLNMDAMDLDASYQKDPAAVAFAHALHEGVENNALGDDQGEYAGARAISGFNADGKMVMLFVDKYGKQINGKDGNPMTVEPNNVDSLLVTKNPTLNGAMNLAMNTKQNFVNGQENRNGTGEFSTSLIDDAIDQVKSKNDFLSASNYSGSGVDNGMSTSLVKALHGVVDNTQTGEPEAKSTALSEMIFGEIMKKTEDPKLLEEFDADEDGFITKKDFVTSSEDDEVDEETGKKVVSNYDKLIKYILSGEDLNLSKQILKTHMMLDAEPYYNSGKTTKAQQNILAFTKNMSTKERREYYTNLNK